MGPSMTSARRAFSAGIRAIPLACTLALILAPSGLCLCPPPLEPRAELAADGTIEVTWFHPNLFADTVFAHQGGFAGGFYLGGDCVTPRTAFRFPPGLGGALVHTVGAYFLAAQGVSSERWDALAAFGWSLHQDSVGVPGRAIASPVSWDLGADTIRSGRTVVREVGWYIPEAVGDSLWLVGRWPENADSVVRIGRDNLPPPSLPTLIGCVDEIGQDRWDSWLQFGLLANVVILRSEHAAPVLRISSPPPTEEQKLLSGNSIDFIVVTETVAGLGSPEAETTSVDPSAGLRYHDTLCSAGQARQYHIATSCAAETSQYASTQPLSVPQHCNISLFPNEIAIFIGATGDSTAKLSISNLDPDTLLVTMPELLRLGASGSSALFSSNTFTLRVSPDSLMLEPDSSGTVTLSSQGTIEGLGEFRGELPVLVRAKGQARVDRWVVTVRATVDARTGVGNDPSGAPAGWPRDSLGVLAEPNPFGDQLVLAILLPDKWLSGDGMVSTAADGMGVFEASIFNLLGRMVASVPLSALPLEAGTNQRTRLSVVFPRTGAWSSGVYFCRVRWGRYCRVVPVVHMR